MQVRIQSEHFIPPVLALFAVLAVALGPRLLETGAEPLAAVLLVLPYTLFLLFAFLALRLNQTAAFCSALLFLLTFVILRSAGTALLPGFGPVFPACALSLTVPLGLLLLFAAEEGPLIGLRGVLHLLAAGLPFVFLLIRRARPDWVTGLFNLRLLPDLPGWHLPDLGLLLLLASGLRLLLVRRAGDGPFRYALVWAFFPFLGQLNAVLTDPPSSLPSRLSLATISILLLLLYGLYRLYWQRVYRDELTGIPNRRAFNERLQALGRRFALAMIDIDHFKAFNDAYGHAEGDNVLRWVAKHVARESGFRAYRYGGEEFALIFSGPRSDEAVDCLEGIRRRLAETDFHIRAPGRQRSCPWWRRRGPKEGQVRVQLTISAGLARPQRDTRKPGEVLRRADEALYRAKKLGRNRVVADSGIIGYHEP